MKKRFWLKAIAVWQMLGGAIGGVVFLDAIPHLKVSADIRWTTLIVAGAIAALSIISGWALLHERRGARGPAILVHALQSVGFGTGALTYRFILGPYVALYHIGGYAGIEGGFTPQLQFHWGTNQSIGPHFIINLLSLTCIVLLLKWKYITELIPDEAPSPPPAPPEDKPRNGPWPPLDWP